MFASGVWTIALLVCFAASVASQTAEPTRKGRDGGASAKQPSAAGRQSEGGQQMNVPSPETMLALVRTNLLALDYALRTGNFSVLHSMGSPFLQSRLSVEGLAQAFAPLRAQRPDLAAVAIATPALTEQPAIGQNGMLRLVGAFPVKPQQIRFEMLFEAAAGEWRLAGMNVAAVRP